VGADLDPVRTSDIQLQAAMAKFDSSQRSCKGFVTKKDAIEQSLAASQTAPPRRWAMALFRFSITIDGDDRPERSSLCETTEDAIQEGCSLLMGPVYLLWPETARCVVRLDGDSAGPAIGVWSYRAGSNVPEWEAADD